MTTTPAAGPGAPADHQPQPRLSRLLKRPVTDRRGESLGRLADVIVRLRGTDYPLVTGLVAAVGGREVFVPGRPGEQLRLRPAAAVERPALAPPLRAPGRGGAAPGRRARPPAHRRAERPPGPRGRPRDGQRTARSGCWPGWTPGAVRIASAGPRLPVPPSGAPGLCRDWHDFEWLIGHAGTALVRGPFARIRRLKPAQIADLLENASKEEETEILGRVHADPELEADVFEELDEDLAARLLGARTDEEIAARGGPDARRRRRRRDRRAAAAAPPAGPGPAAGRPAGQGADADGLQQRQRRRPDGGGLRRDARPGPRWARRWPRCATPRCSSPRR